MSYSVYVGPFLKCFFHYDLKETKKQGCSNCKEEKFNVKFCSKCGMEIKDFIMKEKKKSANYYYIEIDEESTISDIFNSTGGIQNKGDIDILFSLNYGFLQDRCIFEFVEMDEVSIKRDIEGFKNRFKNEIELLEKNYDMVEIKWGIVNTLY